MRLHTITNQILLGMYIIFLALFLRFFWWKRCADQRYWKRRPRLDIATVQELARSKGVEFPFLSLMIPARNEADVIANTLEHLASIEYPADKYEIVVITDAKEQRAFEAGEHDGATTQQIVAMKQKEWRGQTGKPQLKHVMVPVDFTGNFRGSCVGHDVPSTKARALNWALSYLDPRSVICGFYDAESHPENTVSLFVAYRWIMSNAKARLWQGPVYQVRNFFSLGPITKIAALYQAMAHEWYYPALMNILPFIGGTNFYATRELLEKIGGFDPQALTEDLEIGARAYLAEDAWPEYIPFYSTEQTPASLKAYFRQRLRWASGNIQTVDKLRGATGYPVEKQRRLVHRLFMKGQFEWVLYQIACLVGAFFIPLIISGQVDPAYGLPQWAAPWLRLNAVLYYGFTFYLLWRFHRLLDRRLAPYGKLSYLTVPLELLFLPVAGFIFPLPYTSAIVLKMMGRQQQTWVKTPRTREIGTGSVVTVRATSKLAMSTAESSRRT